MLKDVHPISEFTNPRINSSGLIQSALEEIQQKLDNDEVCRDPIFNPHHCTNELR